MAFAGGSIFANRLAATVQRKKPRQLKSVRLDEERYARISLKDTKWSNSWIRCTQKLLVIVIIVALDVHNSFAGLLKRATAPSTYASIDSLGSLGKLNRRRRYGDLQAGRFPHLSQ